MKIATRNSGNRYLSIDAYKGITCVYILEWSHKWWLGIIFGPISAVHFKLINKQSKSPRGC